MIIAETQTRLTTFFLLEYFRFFFCSILNFRADAVRKLKNIILDCGKEILKLLDGFLHFYRLLMSFYTLFCIWLILEEVVSFNGAVRWREVWNSGGKIWFSEGDKCLLTYFIRPLLWISHFLPRKFNFLNQKFFFYSENFIFSFRKFYF